MNFLDWVTHYGKICMSLGHLAFLQCFPSWWPRKVARNGRNVAILPSKYASEHFRIPFAVGVFKYSRNLSKASTVLSIAVWKLPACESVRCNGSCRGPASREFRWGKRLKFEGFCKVIWRRKRSPVLGRMKVPFLSTYSKISTLADEAMIPESNLRHAWRRAETFDLTESPIHLKPMMTSFWSFHDFVICLQRMLKMYESKTNS